MQSYGETRGLERDSEGRGAPITRSNIGDLIVTQEMAVLPPNPSASIIDPLDSTELKRSVPGVEAMEAVEANPIDPRWTLGVSLRNNVRH